MASTWFLHLHAPGAFPGSFAGVGDIVLEVPVSGPFSDASVHQEVPEAALAMEHDGPAAAVFAAAVVDRLESAAARSGTQLVDADLCQAQVKDAYLRIVRLAAR